MGRHRRRTPELRATFVLATAGLLEAQGLDAIRTRDVAAAADSSLAALDELFGNKHGLLDAVALRGFEQLSEQISVISADIDPVQRLLDTGRAYRAFVLQYPRLAELMFSRPHAGFSPTPHDMDVAATTRRAFTTPIAHLLALDRSNGVVVDLSVGLIALVEGLVRQEQGGLLGSTPASARRRFETAVETYLAGARRTAAARTTGRDE